MIACGLDLIGKTGKTEHGYPYKKSENISKDEIESSRVTGETPKEHEAEGGEVEDPAVEPKGDYTRQEWIDWYEEYGYKPEQYTPWLKGAKDDKAE